MQIAVCLKFERLSVKLRARETQAEQFASSVEAVLQPCRKDVTTVNLSLDKPETDQGFPSDLPKDFERAY